MENPFKGCHFQADIMLIWTRWYLRYALGYRDIEELMTERGLSVDHSTIFGWVKRYAPELNKRSRPYLKQTNDSWRVDETYVKVKGQWMYLYRALDSTGHTLDFYFSQRRTRRAAARFFRKTVTTRPNLTIPRVINVDKRPAYIGATRDMKKAKLLPEKCRLRQSQYMNNLIEQDHRFMKWQIRPGLGSGSFPTFWSSRIVKKRLFRSTTLAQESN